MRFESQLPGLRIHDVLQMMGRASRPGIDQSGMVVLLTQNSKKESARGCCLINHGI